MFKKIIWLVLMIAFGFMMAMPIFAQATSVAGVAQWRSAITTSINNLEPNVTLSIKNFDKDAYSLNHLSFPNIQISAEGSVTSSVATIQYTFTYPQNFKLLRAAENPALIGRLSKSELRLFNYAKALTKALTSSAHSDYEKVLKLHNYIVLSSCYDEENFKKGTVPDSSFTIGGLLYDGVGVCESYSATFQLMATFANVKSQIVTGTSKGIAHAWNIVQLDSEFYHIDTTWDDPVPDRKGQIVYKYFNVTDNEIAKDHVWDRAQTPTCAGIKYNYYVYNHMIVSSMAELENYLKAKLALSPAEVQFYAKGFSIKDVKDLAFTFKIKGVASYVIGGEFGEEGSYVYIPTYE